MEGEGKEKEWPKNLRIVKDNILNIATQYIAHQCHCSNREALGYAGAIFYKFPHAKDPCDRDYAHRPVPGTIAVHGDGVEKRKVINMYAQRSPGPDLRREELGERPNWFRECLDKIAAIPDIVSVAFPGEIGCGAAGGNWRVYWSLIRDFAERNPGLDVILIQHHPSCHRAICRDESEGTHRRWVPPPRDKDPKRLHLGE